jgi:hypothetical protein
LAAIITELESTTGTKLGLAALAAGAAGSPATAVTAGSWRSGHAWSTIKVPLAVAALGGRSGQTVDAAAAKAITVSDNEAAQTLWDTLGTPDQAGPAVEAVLRQGGDQTTSVQRTRTRAEFSAFGQTDWSLVDQAAFAAGFPAGEAANQVWELMGQIDSSQRWGLGKFDGAHFKGGWGPDDSGYVVRQFGQIPVPGGCAAIALGTWAPSFEAGTRVLDQLAADLAAMTDILPAGPCRT